MVRIGIAGIGGRMGGELVAAARTDESFTIAGGTERPERVQALAGTFGVNTLVVERITDLIPYIEVLIDFTTPETTLANARACAEGGCRLVAGTTGMTPDQLAELRDLSQRTAIFYARNMSIGINALLTILPSLVRSLEGYDIEIMETHHRYKADAPSGTAIAIGEVIAAALDREFSSVAVHGREGLSTRSAGDIGVHAIRGGGNAGEHTILFADDGEEIRVVHRALSRKTFALGALRAARFLSVQPAGYYTMVDLLASAH